MIRTYRLISATFRGPACRFRGAAPGPCAMPAGAGPGSGARPPRSPTPPGGASSQEPPRFGEPRVRAVVALVGAVRPLPSVDLEVLTEGGDLGVPLRRALGGLERAQATQE